MGNHEFSIKASNSVKGWSQLLKEPQKCINLKICCLAAIMNSLVCKDLPEEIIWYE
jgi:hypothetical protein